MPIADMNPNTTSAETDATCAAKLQKALKRSVRSARRSIIRIKALTEACPGGKAGMNTELAATQVEASAILDKLVALVTAHKATGSNDPVNPLL